MIPVLYEANETQYTTNGIGRLADAVSCVVTEERNGAYELSMEYPSDGIHFSDITEDRIIFAKPSDNGTAQPFRIYRISKPMNGVVTIDAEHISYLLNKIVAMPFTAGSCAEVMAKIPTVAKPSCPFSFQTDKSVTGTYKLEEPRAIRGMLGGEQGSILDTYGKGEYEFDRFNVYLRQNRGSDRGVTLRYGKNITELVRTLDMSDVYTGIVPFWRSEDTVVTLPEGAVMSSHASDFAYQIVKPVDFSESWENAPTEAQLRNRANRYLTTNEGWQLNDNIKVSFIALFDTEEYKQYSALQRVSLCDTVTVIYPVLDVNVKAKVVRTVYDVLMERYNEIELGNTRNSLGKVIQEQIYSAVPTKSAMQAAIANGTALITGNSGGYVVLKPDADGKPQEILIMDTDDINTATKVWRFNASGLGYSNTGYAGTYKQAWTIDGAFYTDWVTTGLMTANIIRAGILTDATGENFWNLETGEVRFSTMTSFNLVGMNGDDCACDAGDTSNWVYTGTTGGSVSATGTAPNRRVNLVSSVAATDTTRYWAIGLPLTSTAVDIDSFPFTLTFSFDADVTLSQARLIAIRTTYIDSVGAEQTSNTFYYVTASYTAGEEYKVSATLTPSIPSNAQKIVKREAWLYFVNGSTIRYKSIRVTVGDAVLTGAQLKVSDDLVETAVRSGDFGTYMQQNYEYFLYGFNGSSKYVQIEEDGIGLYDGQAVGNTNLRAFFDEDGIHFWRASNEVGRVGSYITNANKRGLTFNLNTSNNAGQYMGWFTEQWSAGTSINYAPVFLYSAANGYNTLEGLYAYTDIYGGDANIIFSTLKYFGIRYSLLEDVRINSVRGLSDTSQSTYNGTVTIDGVTMTFVSGVLVGTS